MRCLLIDDDIPTVEALLRIMNWNDYGIVETMTATNIQDAKRLFETARPDIMICDIEMPRGSGLDLIKWVREREYDGGFIFFTCHESFEFASTAISYKADAYLVKPIDKTKLDAALRKAVEALKQSRMLDEYSKLGLTWIKNKEWVERNFWRDILTEAISPRQDLIQSEICKRELTLSVEGQYVLFLVGVPRSQVEGMWDNSIFLYALSNLGSEVLFEQVNHDRVIPYQTESAFYNAMIMEGTYGADQLTDIGERLIELCKHYLKCTITCYIGKAVSISELSRTRAQLEQLDASNIIFRGKVHLQGTPFLYDRTDSYALDMDRFALLFVQKEKVQIVNGLKKELERLAEQNKLDPATLHSIREDFLQVVYSQLLRNHIQAHRLFADEAILRLAQQAESSVFDFMKWAQAITDKTIDSIREALKSEGVVDKAKRFIHENYKQELSREDVAAHVYLTADYLAKVFKAETGLAIKEYLNECRINAAKQLLLESKASVSEIALETGFDTLSYFSTVFKKMTGETPNAYRSKHKSNP
ncbi:helix-turn-helix domain-containing protein [Cohnella thailandensis]|uniref:Helix-turn-helix domain-containing protein n=1 Tax=Cohnella thailandensis TaxID=557557 RepID=A0A841SRM7_9BACL|nr:helix-turn-helix domain-containing protein [Cohnella thailandensis]MBB6634594.1 helix-turn-helix domain-containing protein [Cohnella thailandensis]MBP1972850.1 two-component system response regulator YesN [Cohnella thailandensis]